MKRDTRAKPGICDNEAAKRKPSRNRAGKSKQRAESEDALNGALMIEGSPEEAAKLLWEAARSKEPWAIQELCRRLAPQTQSIQMVHEVNDVRFDYSKLTDEQIQQLESIMEQASPEPVSFKRGEGPAPSA